MHRLTALIQGCVQFACRESAKWRNRLEAYECTVYWSTAHSRKDEGRCPCTVTSSLNFVPVTPAVRQSKQMAMTFPIHYTFTKQRKIDLLLWVGVRRRLQCVNIFFSRTTGLIFNKFGSCICRIMSPETSRVAIKRSVLLLETMRKKSGNRTSG